MLRRRFSSQSGQALIIAVLLLVLLAILSAVFVAFVAHALAQSGRRSDVEAAERMSISGIQYAHRQLRTSSELGDWRPIPPALPPPGYYTQWETDRIQSRADWTFPPFVKVDLPAEAGDDPYASGSAGEEQAGRCLIQVRYVPSLWSPVPGSTWGTYNYPDDAGTSMPGLNLYDYDPLSPFIRVTAMGSSRNSPNVLRVKVAYVPLVLPDRLLSIVDGDETLRPASFGIPSWVDIDGDLEADTNGDGVVAGDEFREFVINRLDGGVHSNTSLVVYGRNSLGWVRGCRGDAVTAAGNFSMNDPVAALGLGALPPELLPGMRFQRLDAVPGVVPTAPDLDWLNPALLNVYPSLLPGGAPAPTQVGAAFDPQTGYVQDFWSIMDPTVDSLVGPLSPDYKKRNAQRIRPGLLDETDDTNAVRLRRLALESGRLCVIAGATRNTAEFGLGRTIYVNNDLDIQPHDPQALHDNWTRAGAQASAYWYGPVYEPPGCEVIFHEKDIAADWNASPPADTGPPPPQRAYGNLPALPDIEIIRRPSPNGQQVPFMVPVVGDTNGNGLADDVNDIWNPGSGNPAAIVGVMPLDIDPPNAVPDNHIILDYPADGCLYFTGNVRVRGKLPIARTDVLSDVWAEDGLYYPRRYDLSVVSRENIYVDGDLMTAVDWWSPSNTASPFDLPEDRYAARIALLSERNVALNATRGEYQGPGIITDCEYIPDTPEGSASAGHWLLEPGKSFITFFGFGGLDLSRPEWVHGGAPADNPMDTGTNPRYGGASPITWRDDLFLKLRVRGSRLSPFHVYINGVPYDFDTRLSGDFPEADGVNPCRQMNANVQTLCIPLAIDGQPMPTVAGFNGEWGGPAGAPPLFIDGNPGNLNSIVIRPSDGMTRPVEIYGVSIERRDEVAVAPGGAGVPEGVPIVTPAGDGGAAAVEHPWFAWSDHQGPPPLVRAGGDVLHSRTMTVSALCYAQHGSFFVVGGDLFDPSAARLDNNGDGRIIDAPEGEVIGGVYYPSDTDLDKSGTPDWAESRRQNLQVQVFGAIAENLPPDMNCVANWTDRLCFPIPDLDTGAASNYAPTPADPNQGWSPVIYVYDDGLRASSPVDPPGGPGWWWWAPAGNAPAWNVAQARCRFARMPVSPDLIYFGDLT